MPSIHSVIHSSYMDCVEEDYFLSIFCNFKWHLNKMCSSFIVIWNFSEWDNDVLFPIDMFLFSQHNLIRIWIHWIVFNKTIWGNSVTQRHGRELNPYIITHKRNRIKWKYMYHDTEDTPPVESIENPINLPRTSSQD